MLNRKSHTPLYIQLADHLRKQIITGAIKVGDKLPSETEMIKEYKLGRLTIRDALSVLLNEGLIEKHHGKGTFCKACINTPKYRIDVLLNLTDMYFVPHYLHAICDALEQEDVNIVLNDTKNDEHAICACLERVLSEGSDGVIFQPTFEAKKAGDRLCELLSNLVANGIPYIMIDSLYENVPQSYAVVNEENSGAIAANYLKSLGHKMLCMIEVDGHHDSVLRKKGFCNALENEPYIITYNNDLKNALAEMIKKHPDITGIFCYNDIIAQKCYKALLELNVRIGEDISVVSVDDTVIASTLTPSLTSVVHPKKHLARSAAEAILAIISGKSDWPFTKTFEPSLNIRKSCKPI